MNKPIAGQSSGMPDNAAQPTEVLAGSIERVTFHNPSNGFCVLRIKARGHRELVTVVGHAAEISAHPALRPHRRTCSAAIISRLMLTKI